jgi:hypothetical protein
VEERWFDENGDVHSKRKSPAVPIRTTSHASNRHEEIPPKKIFPFGIDRSRLGKVARRMQISINLVDNLNAADLLMITKNHYRKNLQILQTAEENRIPIYVLRSNTLSQIEHSLADLYNLHDTEDPATKALEETEEAINAVRKGREAMELSPQNSFIRRLQHEMIAKSDLQSESTGKEPSRRVRIFE